MCAAIGGHPIIATMMVRLARLNVSAMAAGLLLIGCGGASPAASSPGPSASVGGASATAAAPASVSAKPAASVQASGSSAAAGSAAGQPLKIGISETLTGPSAISGVDNRDGFNLYLSSINSTVAGRTIQPIFVDDEFKPDVGLTKTKQLVESDKVQLLMGYTNTAICYAIAPYVKQVQIPLLITGNCGGEKLTTDPAFKSPYISRFTNTSSLHMDPTADYAAQAGFRKAIIMTSDFAAGIENSDFFSSTFIDRGGTIVQEVHPAVGTQDFGPYLAQLDPSADVLVTFLPGADGLHFAEQFATYAGSRKLQVFDATGQYTAGPNLAQLKEKAVGFIAENVWTEAYDDPVNAAFLKAFHDKYPGRTVGQDAAHGYAGAQILAAALEKVGGKVEDKQAFLQAVYATNVDTPKGVIKLDENHDVVANVYIYQIVKQGADVGPKILKVYQGISGTWARPDDQLAHFPYGTLKGKWVGMTKEKLAALMK